MEYMSKDLPHSPENGYNVKSSFFAGKNIFKNPECKITQAYFLQPTYHCCFLRTWIAEEWPLLNKMHYLFPVAADATIF